MSMQLASRMVLAVVGLLVPAILSILAVLPSPSRSSQKPAEANASSGPLLGYGRVDIETHVRHLAPSLAGRVKEVLAQENKVYEAGAPLIKLEDMAAQQRLRQVQAEVREAKIQLEEARVQTKRHQARLRQQEELVKVARKTRETAQLQLAHKRDWLEKKIGGSELELQSAGISLEAHDAAVRAEEARLEELRLTNPSFGQQRLEALVEARQAAVAQVENELRQYQIVAPEKGMVLRILVGRGDLWPAAAGGQPALFFCPDGPRVVRAEVGQDRAVRLKEGQQVLLQDDEDPTLQWQGEIRRIAKWVHPRRSVWLSSQESLDQPTVECIIAPKGNEETLLIGQKLRVILSSGGRQ